MTRFMKCHYCKEPQPLHRLYYSEDGTYKLVCIECKGQPVVAFCAVCGTPKEPSRLFPKIVNGEEKRVCLSCGLLDTRPIEDRITALEAQQAVIVESQAKIAAILQGVVQDIKGIVSFSDTYDAYNAVEILDAIVYGTKGN